MPLAAAPDRQHAGCAARALLRHAVLARDGGGHAAGTDAARLPRRQHQPDGGGAAATPGDVTGRRELAAAAHGLEEPDLAAARHTRSPRAGKGDAHRSVGGDARRPVDHLCRRTVVDREALDPVAGRAAGPRLQERERGLDAVLEVGDHFVEAVAAAHHVARAVVASHDEVTAGIADERVRAVAPGDGVIPELPVQLVGGVRPEEGVVAPGRDDVLDLADVVSLTALAVVRSAVEADVEVLVAAAIADRVDSAVPIEHVGEEATE